MCDCELYPPDVYRESFPRARKQYECCECGAFIQPGDQYRNTFGVWGGQQDTFRTCLPCAELGKVFSHITGHCLCFGDLKQDIIEHAMWRHSDDAYEYECDNPWKVAEEKAARELRRREKITKG